jgi:hypothetical protein
MRALALTAAVALTGLSGCGDPTDCSTDQCGGGDVCARNDECLPPSEVRTVHVSWTIRGVAASPTNCSRTPSFYVLFGSFQQNDTYGYEPVPCEAGLFTIDKLPKRYTSVQIGVDGGFSQDGAFDAQGVASFNLMP